MILGVGLDLAEVDRFGRALERHGEDFLLEILSAGELEARRGSSRFLPSCAAAFAVKEALFKALGTGKRGSLTWQEIEVAADPVDPAVTLHGAAAALAARMGVRAIRAAVATGRRHVAATVVLEGAAPGGGPRG